MLKSTLPGVPDFYRGTELWDFNLVDPDNRRPVDYKGRRTRLEKLQKAAKKDFQSTARDLSVPAGPMPTSNFGSPRQCLAARGEYADLFAFGEYIPLAVDGESAGARYCASLAGWKTISRLFVSRAISTDCSLKAAANRKTPDLPARHGQIHARRSCRRTSTQTLALPTIGPRYQIKTNQGRPSLQRRRTVRRIPGRALKVNLGLQDYE